jgi:small nuclear ribonucleoprotein E
MNLVIDDAVEVKQPTKTDTEEKRRELGVIALHTSAAKDLLMDTIGQILLKGDNVSLIQALQ